MHKIDKTTRQCWIDSIHGDYSYLDICVANRRISNHIEAGELVLDFYLYATKLASYFKEQDKLELYPHQWQYTNLTSRVTHSILPQGLPTILHEAGLKKLPRDSTFTITNYKESME